jgi:phosphatidylglycerophosphate synthase
MPAATRKNLPPLDELIEICGGEGRGSDEPRDFRRLYARLVRRLSIQITRVLLKTGISADQTTILGILIGLAGAALLAFESSAAQLIGLLLLQLSFVIDFCDGEIARFERKVEGKEGGAGGEYLDWVGHYYVPAAITAAIGWAVFAGGASAWIWLAVFVILMANTRIPYSARDHVILSVYRDKPELRDDPAMMRAVLSRMGGDPARIELDDQNVKKAGGSGSGLLWSRWVNIGQLLVFPGFINLVAVAVIADILLGAGDRADSIVARVVLLSLLGVVHFLHQLRAIRQSFEIARLLR